MPLFRERAFLMKNGVPFDVAMSLELYEVIAFTIAFGEFDGNEFDFPNFRWKDKR